MSMGLFIESIAAVFGLIGTVLLAHNGPRAGWGFAAFLVSNIGWLAFSAANAHWVMFSQQIGFTAASLYGAWQWLACPAIDRAYDRIAREAVKS